MPTTSTVSRRTSHPSIAALAAPKLAQLPEGGSGEVVSNDPFLNACSATVVDSAENSDVLPTPSVAVATTLVVPAVRPVIDSSVTWNAPVASVVVCPSQRLPSPAPSLS